MFNKTVTNIIEILKANDVNKLADNYEENIIIDFKDNRPLLVAGKKTPEDVANEFAADVAAFANTSGGLLIYGVKERNGNPIEISSFSVDDLQKGIDSLKDQMGKLLRTRLEPALYGYKIETIKIKDKYLLIVVIPKSFNAPHAVIIPGKDHCQFHGRRSEGGKYSYKYSEIKNAFTLKDRLNDKIRNFRESRINKILNDETPLPLNPFARIILHIIPLSVFDSNQVYDIELFYNNRDSMTPIPANFQGTNTQRRNLEGILFHNFANEQGFHDGYVQLYRNGIIESIDAITLKSRDDIKMIPSQTYELKLIDALKRYLKAFEKLDIQSPLILALTLVGVKGYYMDIDPLKYATLPRHQIETDILILPEIELNDLNEAPDKILLSIFNLIWNACGLKSSLNYDENMNFILPTISF